MLLSDNVPNDDKLGIKPTAQALSEVVLSVELPFCLGILGAWGSGKTTLMNFMEASIEETSKAECVWFNAWKYSDKEIIWNALSQAILFRIIKSSAEDSAQADLLGRASAVAKNLAKLAAKVGTRFIPGDIVKEGDVDEFFNAFGPLSAERTSEFEIINFIEFELEEVIKNFVGEDGRMIVFVDDLDRCTPDNVLEIMEAIKIFFGRSNIVFVLAIERGIIESAIERRYGADSRLTAKEYLEKIVQLPFVMRSVDEDLAKTLLSDLYEDMPFLDEEDLHGLIEEATQSNPRRIKRFVNTLLVLWKLYDSPSGADAKRLSLILLIQLRWPDLFDLLARDLNIVNDYNEIKHKEDTTRASFIAAKPYFSAIFNDRELCRFLDKTQFIDCKPEKLERWVKIVSQS